MSKRAIIDLAGQRQVMLDELPCLTMPTLIVWGTRDVTVPCYQAQAAMARLPRGQLALIPDCGHTPHGERPDLFIAALSRFLAGGAPLPPAIPPQPTTLPAPDDEDEDADSLPSAIPPHAITSAQGAAETPRTADAGADVAKNLRAAVGRVMDKLRETFGDIAKRE